MTRLVVAALVLAAAMAGAGCGLVPAPPSASPAERAPAVTPDAPAVAAALRSRVPTLSRDGYERRAQAITVRVRSLACDGLGTGSGVVTGADTLVTNRHVVAGASRLEVSTADGRSLDVAAAEVGVLGDIAVITVAGDLPVSADLDGRARPGAPVTAVGYPRGGPLELAPGEVVDEVDGRRFGVGGPVLRVTAELEPGNSGGPLLDARGRVVGVVFAVEVATGFGLALPLDTVDALLDEAGTEAVPGCGRP